MKRNIILTLLCIFCSASLCAQKEAESDRKKWGSIGLSVKQLVMFADWFDDKEKRDYIGTYPYPYIQANLNIRLYKDFGAFYNLGIGLGKRNEIPSDYNNNPSINLGDYYQDITSYIHPNNRIVAYMDMGIYHKFYHKEWILVPYLGMTRMEHGAAALSYTLKGKGTNEKYLVDYGWGADKRYGEAKGSTFLTLKFKTERKLSQKFNLDFGLEFNVLVNDVYYRERVRNFYTQEVLHSSTIRGKRLSSVGFTFGVNFR